MSKKCRNATCIITPFECKHDIHIISVFTATYFYKKGKVSLLQRQENTGFSAERAVTASRYKLTT